MRIREKRQQRNITQTELASAVGVAQPSIADYESGKKMPSLSTALKLAEALGCTVDDLVREEGS